MLKFSTIFFCCLAICVLSIKAISNCYAQSVISIGILGDPSDVKTSTRSGTLLMGGSTDVNEAIQWMINRSEGGDFVIIPKLLLVA